jgi:hypothetical protein
MEINQVSPDDLRPSDMAKLSVERLQELDMTAAHASWCPSRHHGECICLRNLVANELARRFAEGK